MVAGRTFNRGGSEASGAHNGNAGCGTDRRGAFVVLYCSFCYFSLFFIDSLLFICCS